MAAWSMLRGRMAELATGEGKTLAASLAAATAALAGRMVHVVTVNDYLAERDHARGRVGEQCPDELTFAGAEGRLALLPPEVRDAPSGRAFEFGVGVEEGHAQASGQARPDRALDEIVHQGLKLSAGELDIEMLGA